MAQIPLYNVNFPTNIRDVLNADGGNVGNDVISFFGSSANINKKSKIKPLTHSEDFVKIASDNRAFLSPTSGTTHSNAPAWLGTYVSNGYETLYKTLPSGYPVNIYLYPINGLGIPVLDKKASMDDTQSVRRIIETINNMSSYSDANWVYKGVTNGKYRVGDFAGYATKDLTDDSFFTYYSVKNTYYNNEVPQFYLSGYHDNSYMVDMATIGRYAFEGFKYCVIITDSSGNSIKDVIFGDLLSADYDSDAISSYAYYANGTYKAYFCVASETMDRTLLLPYDASCPNPVTFRKVAGLDPSDPSTNPWNALTWDYTTLSGVAPSFSQSSFFEDFENLWDTGLASRVVVGTEILIKAVITNNRNVGVSADLSKSKWKHNLFTADGNYDETIDNMPTVGYNCYVNGLSASNRVTGTITWTVGETKTIYFRLTNIFTDIESRVDDYTPYVGETFGADTSDSNNSWSLWYSENSTNQGFYIPVEYNPSKQGFYCNSLGYYKSR